ncbi:MAG: putative sugar O-methyltransferase [Planctomycetes bacterium]|nr:putative sugar O-methyltransferase [Planctomycetota bacterium]
MTVTTKGHPASQGSLVYLRDQEPLTTQEHAAAVECCRRIQHLTQTREQWITAVGKDRSIHLPQANWDLSRSVLHLAYRVVAGGDYPVLNNLRLFSHNFTGFMLSKLEKGPNPPVTAVPENLDADLARFEGSRCPWGTWHRNICKALPSSYRLSPPPRFGEIGWRIGDAIVSYDTCVYLERLALLSAGNVVQRLARSHSRPRILEIGSGYGGLAYYIKKLLPQARYHCLDIPESLLFASIYLGTLFPGDNDIVSQDTLGTLAKDSAGFTFVPNYFCDELVKTGQKFDLVINTLSMSEMSAAQVGYYADAIVKLIADRGVFFEQNQDNTHLGFEDAKSILAARLPWVLLPLPKFHISQGEAHLWAGQRVAGFDWRPSSELPVLQRELRRQQLRMQQPSIIHRGVRWFRERYRRLVG